MLHKMKWLPQIDPGALASVTNNIDLLHEVVKFGTKKKRWTRMKKKHITSAAEGKLRMPALNGKVHINVKCHHHPDFTATLASDSDVVGTASAKREYKRSSLEKFFAPNEEVFEKDLSQGKVDLENVDCKCDHGTVCGCLSMELHLVKTS